LTYETPDDQETDITNSSGNLNILGDFHPKRRQACSLRQKEYEIKIINDIYSDTSTKLQDLSPVLDDGTLLAELLIVTSTNDSNLSLVKSEMRDKDGVDAATLANHLGIRIGAAKSTCLVITQRGIRRMIHPSLTKRYKTNDGQL
jgi:hypothetical protein